MLKIREEFDKIFYREPIEIPKKATSFKNSEFTIELSQEVYNKEYVEALIKQNTWLQEKIFELEMEVDDLRFHHNHD